MVEFYRNIYPRNSIVELDCGLFSIGLARSKLKRYGLVISMKPTPYNHLPSLLVYCSILSQICKKGAPGKEQFAVHRIQVLIMRCNYWLQIGHNIYNTLDSSFREPSPKRLSVPRNLLRTHLKLTMSPYSSSMLHMHYLWELGDVIHSDCKHDCLPFNPPAEFKRYLIIW